MILHLLAEIALNKKIKIIVTSFMQVHFIEFNFIFDWKCEDTQHSW